MRKLLEFRRSPNCVKVRIALNLKGLEFETEEQQGADRAPLIEAGNWPLVPVLVDGDIALGDSEAILIYLDARYREPSLAIHEPDALKSAQRMKAAMVADYMQMRPKMMTLFSDEPRDPEVIAQLQAACDAMVAPFERQLAAGGPYLFGERPSIYDIVIACALMPLRAPASFVAESPFWRSFAGAMALDPQKHAHVIPWYESLMAHDGLTSFE